MMNINKVGIQQETISQSDELSKKPANVPSVKVATSSDQIQNPNDSVNNAPDSNRYFSKNRGNLDAQGVIPVDLINK
jgi:hypothetical protein